MALPPRWQARTPRSSHPAFQSRCPCSMISSSLLDQSRRSLGHESRQPSISIFQGRPSPSLTPSSTCLTSTVTPQLFPFVDGGVFRLSSLSSSKSSKSTMLWIGREVGTMLVVRNASRSCGVSSLFFDRVLWLGCIGSGFSSGFGFGPCVFKKVSFGRISLRPRC